MSGGAGRPVYQTSTSATAAATRLLGLANKGAPAVPVEHMPRVYRSVAGGAGIRVVPLQEGWGLEEIPADELVREARYALLVVVLGRLKQARQRADETAGSKYQQRYLDLVRALEVEAASLVDDDAGEEPIMSSERDNRESEVA